MQQDLFTDATFNGPSYDPEFDDERLRKQIKRVFDCMKDGKFRTVRQISAITKDPENSIQAQLRHLRKARFGGYTVNKQIKGERKDGLWEYQLLLKKKPVKPPRVSNFYKMKIEHIASKGERYFRVDQETDKVVQVVITEGEIKKGKANSTGIYAIAKTTLYYNYVAFGFVTTTGKTTFGNKFNEVIKLLR